MSALGQSRRFGPHQAMSAPPPIATAIATGGKNPRRCRLLAQHRTIQVARGITLGAISNLTREYSAAASQCRSTYDERLPRPWRLIVIANTAAEIADFGDEDGLGNRGRIRTWLGKHDSADFSDLAFRILRHRIEDHLPEVKALRVLQRPVVLAEHRFEIRIGEGMQRNRR